MTNNLPPVYTRFPVNTKPIATFPTTPTTPKLPPVYTNFPINSRPIGTIWPGSGTSTGTPTQPTGPSPTGPSGNCYGGGFPIGFGLGYGLGAFGGYGGGYGGTASAPAASTPVASAPVSDPNVVPASYAATESPAASSLPTTAAATPSANLVVEDLQMVEPATLVAGPAYRLTFRNQGSVAAGAFRVGIFAALDNRLTDSHAVVDVPGLEAGKTAEVILRLPQSALRLVSAGGHSGFDKLAVLVDVDQRVQESDKTNNAAVLDRASLEAAR